VGEGIAIGCSLVAVGLSFFVLLRPPSHSLQKDIKATVKRLEREWDDVQGRMESSSGRLAKQRGLLEKVQRPQALPESRNPVPAPVGGRTSRSDILRGWKVKHAHVEDSPRNAESRGPVPPRGSDETGSEGSS